jgi:hypothetical protein
MTAADLAEIRRRSDRIRLGVRVKVRMPRELWRGVEACALSIDFGVEEWCCGVVRQDLRGKFQAVPFGDETQKGTRAESVTVWARVPEGYEYRGGALRGALQRAVAHYLPHVPGPFDAGLEEGRDYIVGDSESGAW